MHIKRAPVTWRRCLMFSVRGLIGLVLVFGILMGWFVRRARIQRDAVAAIRQARGDVAYDCGQFNETRTAEWPVWKAWISNAIGIDYVANVIWVQMQTSVDDPKCQQAFDSLSDLGCVEALNLTGTGVTDAALVRLKPLKCLKMLELQYCRITSAGLVHLAALPQLEKLTIRGSQIGDEGIDILRGLTGLNELALCYTAVTDAGLVRLRGLSGVQTLTLCGDAFTDAGLAHLRGLNNLRSLALGYTRVTVAGMNELRQALPGSKISY
jgi:hypothetical protein